ncbi:formylglycine-generating enzyme family protein [Nostoc spongiaeforme FACHB-130]|uniref:Formylglycine-generating enzyme family protein n=1 Tax=Nostoc spongiaeforme FACHB-130 TaxID=1357510 RepID=A0ABR8FZY4_9NOSO|nr:formylglycine-generating enzyme family protein [Nostoc spongiaeforme]MBD2596521.1 formylglycine-generating enzyme family protein [Nostoc spongiaeforme FACHB-130]
MANKPPSKINSQKRDKMDDLTTRRLRVVEQRYGKKTLELAYHAAFPLTITSDLLYCLRETFVQDSPWYAVADVLLSGLCQTIGHDLYEMEEDTRYALIQKLHEDENFGEQRLQDLSNFMSHYILNRFKHETNNYRREWIPLSYLMADGKEVNAIKEQLRNLLEALPEDDEERIKWKELETKYQDFLREKGFEPLLLKLEDETDEESTLNDEEKAIAKAMGVELKPFEYEVAVISQTFKFNTVTVNARGEVIKREENQAIYYVEFLGKAAGEPSQLKIEMVAIPGGTFRMGSPKNELGRYEDESPQHTVTIKPFFMGKYPVTQAQWRFVAQLPQVHRKISSEPFRFQGDTLPVEQVSWYDAVEFCSRLSQFTGRPYTLPTEAEWEYACRAGTTTPFHFGETITSELANCDANYSYGVGVKGRYRGETTEVGSFGVANAFGLYDMHGNVWEWCLDDWHSNYEGAPTDASPWFDDDNLYQKPGNAVLRGGSWSNDPEYCRSAFRNNDDRAERAYINDNIGFRVVCAAGRILSQV